jgi:hypothetical protein
MFLIELLLPLRDQAGHSFPREAYDRVREELTARHGGVTAHARAPAEGLWKKDGEKTERDDVVSVECMVEALDRAWWRNYREELERRFRQDEVVVRATRIERL